MKNLAIIFIMSLTISQIHAQTQLEKLADENNFFGLREAFEECSHTLSRKDLLYWTTICSAISNDCEKSLEAADKYLKKFGRTATDQKKSDIYKTKGDVLIRLNRYAEAAEAYSTTLNNYAGELSEKEKDDISNSIMLCSALKHIPPQTTEISTDHTIPYNYNLFNHIMVSVSSGGQREEFIFDTGANLSTTTESQATAMGMEIIDTSIEVGTSTDIKMQTKLAVAKTFSVGDMVFENVVFIVVPDNFLSFPEIDLEIKGIVGFPVIYQMREIRIGRSDIKIPHKQHKREINNLCLEGLMPIVYGYAGSDRLTFTMDTGANKSELAHRYYEKNKELIERTCTLATHKRGGGGGIIEGDIYELPEFNLTLGSRDIELPTINIVTQPFEFNEDKDGNLGQDVLMHYPVMVLSFEHMFLDFDDE